MKKILWQYRYLFAIGCVLVLMIFFIYSYVTSNSHTKQVNGATVLQQKQLVKTNTKKDTQSKQITKSDQEIVIDVKGAVKHPGIYQGSSSNRVQDMIRKAGGFLKKADSNQVNLAQKVTDEMVIYVPQKGDNKGGLFQGSANTTNSDQEIVNINTASTEQLETLPGLGPSKAAAIISYREENGFFSSENDIKNVSGIGDKTFEKLKPSITVN